MRDDVGLVCVGLALLFMIAILYGHQRRESFANESNVWESIQREVEADLQTFLVFDVGTFRANTADQKKFFAMVDGRLTDEQRKEVEKVRTIAEQAYKAKTPPTDQFNPGYDASWDFILNQTELVSNVISNFRQVGVDLTSPSEGDDPSVKENAHASRLKKFFKSKFDLDKPFDTRIALLDAQYAYAVEQNKNGKNSFADIPVYEKETDQDRYVLKMFFMMTIPTRHLIPGAKSMMYTMAKAYMSSPFVGLQNTKALPKTGSQNLVSGVVSSIFGS
jgi:hypothetical protein